MKADVRKPRSRLATGVRLRSRLFGGDYVQSAFAGGALNREVQDLITEFGYGSVWSRPGLPIALRSMLTLGLLAALNRPDQLKAHLRGALNVGVTRREIVEVFIHVILYCGAPAGLSAVKTAMETFHEWDAESKVGAKPRAAAQKTSRSRTRPPRALRTVRRNTVRR
jgi:4-carboxymuconolactone decarboxylase